MPDRVKEKLVEIVQNSVGGCARNWAEVIADGLIANGVTVQDNTQITDELLEQLRNTPVTILPEEPTIKTVQDDEDNNVPIKWISVKDRLPENRDDVLVCRTWWNETRNPHIGWYNDVAQEWQILDSDGYYPCGKVTYWMPLPQPPKGEREWMKLMPLLQVF